MGCLGLLRFCEDSYKLAGARLGGLSVGGSQGWLENLSSREVPQNFWRSVPEPCFISVQSGEGGHGPKDNKQCCLLEIQTGRRKEARRRASILTSGQTFGDAFESDLLSTTVGVSLKNSQLRAQTFSECTVWSGILFVGFCLWRSA